MHQDLDPAASHDLERDRQLNRLLEHCLDLPEDQRSCYLEASCPDESLRQEVIELLEEDLGDFLETPSPFPSSSQGSSDTFSLSLIPICYFSSMAMQRGDYASAQQMLEKTVSRLSSRPDITHAMLHRSLGQVYLAQNQIASAIAQLKKAIDLLEASHRSPTQEEELKITRFELLQAQNLGDPKPQKQSVLDFLT